MRPRRIVRPFGTSIPASRTFSLLFMLAVLWMIYDGIRQPAAWHWLAAREKDQAQVQAAAPPANAQKPVAEVIVPGPNDLDPAEVAEFTKRVELITDRTELRPREMIPYWQLVGWSRTQPFADFEKRAMPEPAFTQIWEQPERYRGKPVRMRMHVRRVLQYDAPKNPLGVKEVFEAWGWTDESKSFPYTIVFTEKPAGLPVGPDVNGEVVFVGYFMKVMSYTAFDVRRGAPLLLGRVRMAAPRPGTGARPAASSWEIWGAVAIGGFVTMVIAWFIMTHRKQPKKKVVLPDDVTSFSTAPSEPSAFPSVIQLETSSTS